MHLLSSLSNRIFLLSALLAVLAIGAALFVVSLPVTRQAEAELDRGLEEAGQLVVQFQSLFFEHLVREARLIADLPRLKAAVYEDHAPTVQPVAEQYRREIEADIVIVTNRAGVPLAVAGDEAAARGLLRESEGIREALDGRSRVVFWSSGEALLQVVSVPIFIDPGQEILGTLTAGVSLSRRLADRIKALTQSEVVFVDRGAVQASTLPALAGRDLGSVGREGASWIAVDGEEYEVVRWPLTLQTVPGAPAPAAAAAPPDAGAGPYVLVLRSRTAHQAFLRTLYTWLAVTAALAVLLATVLSYAVARTVTRPIRALTETMRAMASAGTLAAHPAPPPGRWEDEDARVLTETFRTLTASLERSQQEARQKERLSSLGRLSTVLAHEVRNPLMIIKASLRALRRSQPHSESVLAAVGDIEGEVGRLNRIVHEVLDYARPIAFSYQRVDVGRLVRDAAHAVTAGQAGPAIDVDTPAPLDIVTDGERVRQALVNVLANARDAVLAREKAAEGALAAPSDGGARDGAERTRPGDVTVAVRPLGDHQVEIVVQDTGIGVPAEQMSRIFEPFFTTKTTGSGIGLAITRNIVDGLGGGVTIESEPGRGTTVRLTLPRKPTSAMAS